MEDLVTHINKLRLSTPTGWYVYVDAKLGIEIKAYKTWLQIFRIKGINYASNMNMNVGEYKKYLRESLKQGLGEG